MQTNISVRHGQLNAETQQKITDKVEKLRRFFDRVSAIQVTVDIEHPDTPHVELRVSADRTEDFLATDRSTGVMAALDNALHKVENQLRKHKEKKRTDRRGTGIKHLEVPVEPESETE